MTAAFIELHIPYLTQPQNRAAENNFTITRAETYTIVLSWHDFRESTALAMYIIIISKYHDINA